MKTSQVSEHIEEFADGRNSISYILRNNFGTEVKIMDFGATIRSIKFPLSDTLKPDLVLGFDTAEEYEKSFQANGAPYYGSVVGRFAGRINKGAFSINGEKIQLNPNFYGHHLHGGHKGFSSVFWKLKEKHSGPNPSVMLTYTSKDGEENYPGNLVVDVTYTLTENNELVIEYEAVSEKDTIINLTQHSYFNLDGQEGDIAEQQLYINADKILETHDDNIPTGKYINLEDHAYDFRNMKSCPNKIDNTFVILPSEQPQAVLKSTQNNLQMSVFTNQPAIQVFIGGAYEGELTTKGKVKYHDRSGICFETQNFPDAPNHSGFPSAILNKGETYHHRTVFKFENS